MYRLRALAVLMFAACPQPPEGIADAGVDAGADGGIDAGADAGPADPLRNRARDIVTTHLDIDLSTLTGVATIGVGASAVPGLAVEAFGLRVDAVTREDAGALGWTHDAGWLDVACGSEPASVVVRYGFTGSRPFPLGLLAGDSTVTWPTSCSNIFPCHSNPADGVVYTLNVHGNPAGTTVVFPASTVGEAPAYQVGWATGAFFEVDLGFTDAGTQVLAWQRSSATPGPGVVRLREIVDWYERTYGPYFFGPRTGAVDVSWGIPGGIEQHPFWHVSGGQYPDVEAHEAAHGWFGDAVRLRCWEDMVISEGFSDYLMNRVLSVLGDGGMKGRPFPTPGSNFGGVAWLDTCGVADPFTVLNSGIYARGAWFLAALEGRVGTAAIDASLRRFYLERRGTASGVQDFLDTVQTVTGYDANACARAWLKSTTAPAAPCPP